MSHNTAQPPIVAQDTTSSPRIKEHGPDATVNASSIIGRNPKEQRLRIDTNKALQHQKVVAKEPIATTTHTETSRKGKPPHHKSKERSVESSTRTRTTGSPGHRRSPKPNRPSTSGPRSAGRLTRRSRSKELLPNCVRTGLGLRQVIKEVITTIKDNYNAGVEAAIVESRFAQLKREPGREYVHHQRALAPERVKDMASQKRKVNQEKPLLPLARKPNVSRDAHKYRPEEPREALNKRHINKPSESARKYLERCDRKEQTTTPTSVNDSSREKHVDNRRITKWPVLSKAGEDHVSETEQPSEKTTTGICSVCLREDSISQSENPGKLLCRTCLSLGFLPADVSFLLTKRLQKGFEALPEHNDSLETRSATSKTLAADGGNGRSIPRKPVPFQSSPQARSTPLHDTAAGKKDDYSNQRFLPSNKHKDLKEIATRRGEPIIEIMDQKVSDEYVPAPWRSLATKETPPKAKRHTRRATANSIWDDDIPEGGYIDKEIPPVPALPQLLGTRTPALAPLEAIGQPRPLNPRARLSNNEKSNEGNGRRAQYSPSIYSVKDSPISAPKMSHKAVPESQYEDLYPELDAGWWMLLQDSSPSGSDR